MLIGAGEPPSWGKRTQVPPGEVEGSFPEAELRMGLGNLTPQVLKARQHGVAGDPTNRNQPGKEYRHPPPVDS